MLGVPPGTLSSPLAVEHRLARAGSLLRPGYAHRGSSRPAASQGLGPLLSLFLADAGSGLRGARAYDPSKLRTPESGLNMGSLSILKLSFYARSI